MTEVSAELARLQRSLRDLVALSAMPAVWVGLDPQHIAENLADTLGEMLDADFAYCRLPQTGLAQGIDVVRRRGRGEPPPEGRAVADAMRPHFASSREGWAIELPSPFGSGTLRTSWVFLGAPEEGGVVAVGFEAPHALTEPERLLLRVGANLAAVWIQQKRAEEERQTFGALVENSTDFIGMAGLDGRGLYLNPAGRAQVGLAADADVSMTKIDDYVPEDFRALIEETVIPSLRATGRWAGEIELRNFKTHQSTPFFQNMFLVRKPGTDEPLCFATVARDITRSKRAAAELERAGKAKDDFLAMLGHELRNPLAPVVSALDILRLPGSDLATRDWAIEVMQRQIKHMVRLIDDLLDVSRITHGKISLTRAPVKIREILDQAVEAAMPLMEERGHRLTVDVEDPALAVDGDATRLVEVFVNLLTNAARYTPDGGEIEVTADREGGEIHVWVRDNGMGMPPGLVQNAFGLFVQGDRALDRSSGGLGIGLTMVKNLVQLHGGTVEAHSAGLGKGSEFLVRLPAWDGDAAELDETATGQRRREPPRELFRVLVVDDSVDLAEGIAALLTDAGHDVRTAYDGMSGLDVAVGFRPEVVLLDVGLPGLTGYEVADRLREIPGVEESRIVAITGYGQESDKAEAKLHGFDDHMVKPVSFDKLQSVIAAPRRPSPRA
ncbi:MAG: ATP-binding protein [Acidobacteriota bacterium]|nr:ATP-binding protein [Acidobacteriota bacterium]